MQKLIKIETKGGRQKDKNVQIITEYGSSLIGEWEKNGEKDKNIQNVTK